MSEFATEILQQLEALFEEGEIETLMRSTEGTGLAVGPADAAVKVIHRPSGEEEVCAQYPSQIRNKAMALARLAGKLRSRS